MIFEFGRGIILSFLGWSTIIQEVKVGLTSLFLRRLDQTYFLSNDCIIFFHDFKFLIQ